VEVALTDVAAAPAPRHTTDDLEPASTS
jgi:hypothetical protein